jgi:hypothetical protein
MLDDDSVCPFMRGEARKLALEYITPPECTRDREII